MQKPFDFLVFIGRFQPFHSGHLTVVQAALEQAGHLIVLCGSSHQPRSTRNPWSWQEREQMLRSALPADVQQRVLVAPLMDSPYNDEYWVRNVQATVNGLVAAHHRVPHKPPRIGLIGHRKDHSSYYLNLFPQWGSVDVDNREGINATDLRNGLFGVSGALSGVAFLRSLAAQLPGPVCAWLTHFAAEPAFQELQDEQAFVAKYKKAWAVAPYTPSFVTVDAVVVQSGHILLVERKARPGKGLLALPGGFVDPQERIRDACLRELKEETKIKVPLPVLRGSIKRADVFDDPYRSARGRTITHAFYIELEPSSELPKVKGGDDARTAQWVPLGELDPVQMFEDHYFIVQAMIGL
jgi:bifunctional NMN adenylyltransferase/nudix hydrolase